LVGNWPNPFNPSTRIAFSLDRAMAARVDVLDPRGRLLRQLHDGPLGPGGHELSWDGRDDAGHPLASGVYLVRLAGEGQQRRLKVLLLK
jgi:hypothetical protein